MCALIRRSSKFCTASMRPGEAAADNAFDDEVIGGSGGAYADTEIELPLRAEVDIDGRKKLLLLVFKRQKIGCRAESAVVFQTTGNFLCDVVAELCIRRKRDSLMHAQAVPGTIKGRI